MKCCISVTFCPFSSYDLYHDRSRKLDIDYYIDSVYCYVVLGEPHQSTSCVCSVMSSDNRAVSRVEDMA